MIRESVKRFSGKIMPKLDCQDVYQTGGLFTPMFVDHRTDSASHRLSQRIRVATARLRQTFDGGDHGVEDDVVERLARFVLLGGADQIDPGIVDEFALLRPG